MQLGYILFLTSRNRCLIKVAKGHYQDMKVQFNVEWLTVSRLNRLETFFRICDFFFLLEVILLLCYRSSTESDVLLIQLIPSLKLHQGTYLSRSSHKTSHENCTAQDRYTVESVMFG